MVQIGTPKNPSSNPTPMAEGNTPSAPAVQEIKVEEEDKKTTKKRK